MFPRAAFAVLGAAAACSAGSADQLTQPVALAMTASTAPYYQDTNLTLYEVQIPVPLPVRRPTPADLKSLGGAPAGTPYTRPPFLTADEEQVEVHFVVSNIDSVKHDVWVLLDPWNEFVRYRPGVTVVDEDVTIPNQSYEPGGPGFVVEPYSRVEGTVTFDDMHELAIKLASVEKYLASVQTAAMAAAAAAAANPTAAMTPTDTGQAAADLANHILNNANRSNSGDPLYDPWIPPVIAGLTGFDLGLRTLEPANVAVEITVNVVDVNGNRFVSSDTTSPRIGLPPMTLSPPGARF